MKMKPIPTEWIQRFKLNDVPSPEDSSKRRMFHLEVITIPQSQPTTTPKVTGQIDFNVEELASYYFYGHRTTRGHIDCTIIISSLSETEDTSQARPKLLLLRFHRLIKSSVSDNDVLRLHAIIGAVSGKHGFEMTRLGGSSDRTSDQSDRDFLHAMQEVNASLPVRCGACKITRDELWYNVLYRKVNPKTDKSVIGHAKYSPAQRGGSFDMQPGMLTEFPWLGEFSYLKMLSVMVISTLNEKRNECGELPVAEGPVAHEMENVLYARSCFKKSGSYFFLISNFNLRNRYSLVCHSVGLHNDVFHCGSESIENKLQLIDITRKGDGSRGGSLFGNFYCFAILDWSYEARTRRGWAVANLGRWGLNPHQAWNQNRMDNQLPIAAVYELECFLRE